MWPLLLLACATEPPAALPPPEARPPAVDARRVKAPGVEGLLARPLQGGGPAVLLLVDEIDEAARTAAQDAAAGGAIALVITPERDQAAARAYLERVDGAALPVETRCLRRDCEEAP